MPFGLFNSQATFQRLMDTTLRGLKQVESYIDDCIIFFQASLLLDRTASSVPKFQRNKHSSKKSKV